MAYGIRLAFVTALISGISIFASKIFVSTMDPLLFTTLKNLLVAIILTIGLAGSPIKQQCSHLTLKQWKQLALIGLIGGGIPFALFFTGLTMTSAVQGSIIHKTLFIWVAIMAYWLLKEKLNRWQVAAYGVVTMGALWIANFKNFGLGQGELMILAATLLWSVEHIVAKKALTDIPSEIVAWARMTFGVIVLMAILAIQGKAGAMLTLNGAQITAVLIGGGLLTIYVLTWYKALSSAPANIVSLVLASSPVITSLLSAVFITKSVPAVPDIITMIALTGGVMLATRHTNQQKLIAV